MSAEARRTHRLALVASLVLLALLGLAALVFGETLTLDFGEVLDGFAFSFGLGAEASGSSEPSFTQSIFELRFGRATVASCVGAALAVSGALLQGLFRNPLASPSVLGVTSGAALGATLALAIFGGLGPAALVQVASAWPLVFVPGAAFLGALAVTFVLLAIGARSPSSTTLLLAGIGIATLCGGLVQTVQSLVLSDWELSASITAWSFGSLEDRTPVHAIPVALALLVTALMLPFVRRELDMLAFGDDDARALGVRAQLLRVQVVVLASLLAAVSVAVAGQIAFVGLVVPNLVRLLVSARHAQLLPISALVGASLLLGVDLLQRSLLQHLSLQPGALLSLLGAPFFLAVVLFGRRSGAWS